MSHVDESDALYDWQGEIHGLLRHGGPGRWAPHKPLLLLAALSRYAADRRGELAWAEDERWLDGLLREHTVERAESSHMGDPFVRLQTSRLWTVMQQDGSAIAQEETSPAYLRRVGAVGMLTPHLRWDLRLHPPLRTQLVGELLGLVDAPDPEQLRRLLAL